MKNSRLTNIFQTLMAATLLAVLCGMVYGYTVNIVLNDTSGVKISKSKKANSLLTTNSFEEELPSESKSNVPLYEEVFFTEPLAPKISTFKYTYKNAFDPEVISPPPDYSLLHI